MYRNGLNMVTNLGMVLFWFRDVFGNSLEMAEEFRYHHGRLRDGLEMMKEQF